jgi:DNA repair protein RecO
MTKYDNILTAFVLKSQPLNEADMLVTWYSQSHGKLRSIVAASRRMQSRLSFATQPGSIARIRLVGQSETALLKLASAEVVQTFVKELTVERGLLLSWFFEVVLRATPDGQANEELYTTAVWFFGALEGAIDASRVGLLGAATIIRVMQALGFAIHETVEQPSYFSVQGGGFFLGAPSYADAMVVTPALWQLYNKLQDEHLDTSVGAGLPAVQLFGLLEKFLEYQLERPIRSYEFLGAILNTVTV